MKMMRKMLMPVLAVAGVMSLVSCEFQTVPARVVFAAHPTSAAGGNPWLGDQRFKQRYTIMPNDENKRYSDTNYWSNLQPKPILYTGDVGMAEFMVDSEGNRTLIDFEKAI